MKLELLIIWSGRTPDKEQLDKNQLSCIRFEKGELDTAKGLVADFAAH